MLASTRAVVICRRKIQALTECARAAARRFTEATSTNWPHLSRFAVAGNAIGMLLYRRDPEQMTLLTAEASGRWPATAAGHEVHFKRPPWHLTRRSKRKPLLASNTSMISQEPPVR